MPYCEDGSRPNNETMRELCGQGGPLAARWCAKCDSHYDYCKCTEPDWKLRSNGKLGPLPGQSGGPETLESVIRRRNHDPREN
jgi:hypothetical protein